MERTPVSFGPGVFFILGGIFMDKVFKTYDEQIALLNSRGIEISTSIERSDAKKALQHYGYYNLINGYKMPFLVNDLEESADDKYKKGTKINEIKALYNFDARIRRIFFKYILLIETNIKNLIAYSFSQAHPQENYLVYTNFNRNLRDSNKLITNLISDIQRQISSRVSDPCISHYLKEHGYIPLWVLNSILTLGTISNFYKVMNQKERQEISKIFKIQDNELENILMYITPIRNFCAHNNRLYCYRTKKPLTDLSIHDELNIPRTSQAKNEYAYGKRDLFAAVLAMKTLLSDMDFKKFLKEINNALNIFRPRMRVIEEKELLSYMGFPEDWRESLLKIKTDCCEGNDKV